MAVGARIYDVMPKRPAAPMRFTERGMLRSPLSNLLILDEAKTHDPLTRPRLWIVRMADLSMLGIDVAFCTRAVDDGGP